MIGLTVIRKSDSYTAPANGGASSIYSLLYREIFAYKTYIVRVSERDRQTERNRQKHRETGRDRETEQNKRERECETRERERWREREKTRDRQ